MITLAMDKGRASVKRDGDVRGQIEFVGESENGEYVFIPRDGTIIFRSGELEEIARQVALLNGATSPVETKSSGAETPAEPTEAKTKGDAAADRVIAAFSEGEEYLADSDLLKASGLKRSEYIEVRDYWLYTTNELVEMEAEEDGATVYAYAKPRKTQAAA